MRALFLGLTTCLTLAGAAVAQPAPGSSIGLQNPVASPMSQIVDGVRWSCAGAACVAVGEPRSQSVLRACQRAAARVGPVTSFTYAGRTLESERLPECNAQARDVAVVRAR